MLPLEVDIFVDGVSVNGRFPASRCAAPKNGWIALQCVTSNRSTFTSLHTNCCLYIVGWNVVEIAIVAVRGES